MKGLVKAVTKPLMDVAEHNYWAAKKLYMVKQDRAFNKHRDDPVLVYQMGKVGSSSIVRSLKALDLDRAVYHTHLLTDELIEETEASRKKFFRTDKHAYLMRPWLNRFLKDKIDKGIGNRRWKVISLVREPLSRNIAAFFENCEFVYLPETKQYRISSDLYAFEPLLVNEKGLDDIVELFLKWGDHDTPLKYFDKQIKRVFGIDVYASAFDRERGYQVYEGKNADLMVLKLEKLDDCAAEAFRDFLGIENFSLVNANVASQKDYAELYKNIKSFITFPKAYVDRLYDSRFMSTFYTDEEKTEFLSRWKISDK